MSQSQVGTVTTTPGRALSVQVGSVLLFAGLGLIVLGGCFLIGIWIMIGTHGIDAQTETAWSKQSMILMISLYALAAACLLGSVALIVLGVRSLLGLLKP